MDPVRVLLIGCGGREHAIALAIKRSLISSELFCVGPYRNPALLRLCTSYAECAMNEVGLIVKFACQIRPRLCVIGPELPLSVGVVDALQCKGYPCIGTPQDIAQLETDKGWCRDFLVKYGMQDLCPQFRVFNGFAPSFSPHQDSSSESKEVQSWTRIKKDTRYQRLKQWDEVKASALDWINNHLNGNYVVKPGGLNGGKGVKLSGEHLLSIEDGINYCHTLFTKGCGFVIEEKLVGQEFSLISLTDGVSCYHFPVAIDYKRAYDGNEGLNTGGMGCIVYGNEGLESYLHPIETGVQNAARAVTEQVVNNLAYEFNNYTRWAGVLFAGFMWCPTSGKLKLLEYNVRFGDPEAIGILASQPSVDLLKLMLAATEQRLQNVIPRVLPSYQTVCTIYVVPQAYPASTTDKVRVHYRELAKRILDEVSDTEIQVVCAGLHIPCMQSLEAMTGNIRTEVWHNVTITEDAENMLESGKAHITGSRTFAISAIGLPAIKKLSSTIFPRLKVLLGNQFRWRTDIQVPITHHRLPNPCSSSSSDSSSSIMDDDDSDSSVVSKYEAAGVNINEANRAVTSIQAMVRSTHEIPADREAKVLHVPGGFGGLVCLGGGCDQQILVSSTDSVGSKSELVFCLYGEEDETGFRGLGRDLVNHCVNDILAMGCTRPLWFLDYFATHTLKGERLRHFIKGVTLACNAAGCALIGGETAEIKDVYREGAHDLVGCITGIMRQDEMFAPHTTLSKGDRVVALPSVSAHTNGFTLINQIYRNCKDNLSKEDRIWFTQLAAPHKSYLHEIKSLFAAGVQIKALVHITGGGLVDNPPRVLPPDGNLSFVFNRAIIKSRMPRMFQNLWHTSGITSFREMARTFNCGIGMLIICESVHIERISQVIPESFDVGVIDYSDGGSSEKVIFSEEGF